MPHWGHATPGALHIRCILHWLHSHCVNSHWVHCILGVFHTAYIAYWVHCILGALYTGCMHTGCTPYWMGHTLSALYTGHITHGAHYMPRVLHMHTLHTRCITHCIHSALGLLSTRCSCGQQCAAVTMRGPGARRDLGFWVRSI